MADHKSSDRYRFENPHPGRECAYQSRSTSIDAVGHRIVQGGKYFSQSTLIDDDVIDKIDELRRAFAPLHNKSSYLSVFRPVAIRCPVFPMVAVFDTSFFQTLPPKAYMYALPYQLYEKHGIRKYGAHGTSHRYISERAAVALGESYCTTSR